MTIGLSSSAVFDQRWDAGADVARNWAVANSGAAVNLTGYSASLIIYSERGGVLLATLAATTPDNTGILTFALPDTTSALWNYPTAVYDVELTDSGGLIERLFTGTVELNHSVSKAV